jgi:hypothetical protein
MKSAFLFAVVAIFSCLGLNSTPASAQVARTWVSGVGDDANPCSRTAPCKTFSGAISRTAAGGEINCVDAGGFGVLMITRAISIRCSGGEAGILASGTDGIIINASPGDQVVLEGLDIEGNGTGLDGIAIQAAGEVLIGHCNIHGFTGNGVTITTSTLIRVIIRSSTIGENAGSGVMVNSSPGFGHVRILDSMINSNGSNGVGVNGQGNDAFVFNDEILGNARQINVSSGVAGGVVYSLGNNLIPNSAGDMPTPFSMR